MNPRCCRLLSLVWLACAIAAGAQPLPVFDFATADGLRGWQPTHHIGRWTPTAEGLQIDPSGEDPYFSGPARDYPPDQPLWLVLEARSDRGGMFQVFHHGAGSGPSEAASVRFTIPGGRWSTTRVPMPSLGPAHHLRLDPPGDGGTCIIRRVAFEPRTFHPQPPWPAHAGTEPGPDAQTWSSGAIRIRQHPSQWPVFTVELGDREVARGHDRPIVGYRDGSQDRVHWWQANPTIQEVHRGDRGLEIRAEARDPGGARWRWLRRFTEGRVPGTVEVEVQVVVDRAREVFFAPMLVLATGAPDEGTRKQQALLAGVEYLEDEPSSSEADLEGPQARRQVVELGKLTFPLAAVVSGGHYLALDWDLHPDVAVLFDSPDRLLGTGRHLVGLILPGSDGLNRPEGSLVPYSGLALAADRPATVSARLLAGSGATVVQPVQHYIRIHGLPPRPQTSGRDEYFRLAASGWLDTGIRDGDRFRHALGAGFPLQPAADAAAHMLFLARHLNEPDTASRLRSTAERAMALVPEEQRHRSGVGHVRTRVAALLGSDVMANAREAREEGTRLLGQFRAAGLVEFRPREGALDYARTHWSRDANGLSATVVARVLDAAAFSGDAALLDRALEHLRGLARYRGTVPRGAQTWEIALHTPDILASAHLVDAYTLGYELTGDRALLEEAEYWAWTGVPFVYLRQPFEGPVGPYATTPVLGATQWVAPNWIGLPVQWCGLVYGAALHRLARHLPQGPWRELAHGIAASGVQQTYPHSAARPERAGLLPDSFTLSSQHRNPADINPATLLATASLLYGAGPLHDFRCSSRHRVGIHAPGEIRSLVDRADGVTFEVAGWPAGPFRVWVNRLPSLKAVRVGGQDQPLDRGRYDAGRGWLVLETQGVSLIELDL